MNKVANMPDVAKPDSKVHRTDLSPTVKPAAVKSAHDKAAEIPINDTKKSVSKPVAKSAPKVAAQEEPKKNETKKGGWTEPPKTSAIKEAPRNTTTAS